MKLVNYETRGLYYLLPYFRQNKDIVAFIKIIGERFNMLQEVIFYLLNSYTLRNARGIWLDYAGKEIGAERDEVDYGDFFTVNRLHLNTPKMFYFLSSGLNPKSPLSLNDAEFLQKIYAYIGTNTSSATIENLIFIVQTISSADKVEIFRDEDEGLKLSLQGNTLVLTLNTINYFTQILSNGIYLKEIKTNV